MSDESDKLSGKFVKARKIERILSKTEYKILKEEKDEREL